MGFSMWIALVAVVLTLTAAFIVRNASVGERHITRKLERLYSADDPQFARSMSVLLGPAILGGNRVETLVNGTEIFPTMLSAIRGAQRTITFETYIYWSGSIGQDFARALADRACAGIAVHVLLDWIGSMKMEEHLLQDMRDAGVQVERYHKPHWWRMAWLNNRTHRKLLVIDGAIGFTGGVGIADQWRGNATEDAQRANRIARSLG